MADPVFDITKCDIATVFPVPQGDWFERLSVPQSPQAIDDCIQGPIQMPDPEPPCPTLLPNEITSDVAFTCGTQGVTRFTIEQGLCCDFTFDIQISIPCPQFPDSALQIAPKTLVPYGSECVRWQFIPYACDEDEGDVGDRGCGFDFAIEVDFPYPQLPQKSVSIDGDWGSVQLSFWITDPYGFDFDLTGNFDIPQLPIKTESVTEDWGDLYVNFVVTEPYGFDFDIDINVNIPCPQFPYDAEADTNIVPVGEQRASIGVRPREKVKPDMLNLLYQNHAWLECDSTAYLSDPDYEFEVGCWVQLRAPARTKQVLMSKWDADDGFEWELTCEGDGTGNYNYFKFRCIVGGSEYSIDSQPYHTPLHACHLVRAWHDLDHGQIGMSLNNMYALPVSVVGSVAQTAAPFRIGASKEVEGYVYCDSKIGGAYFRRQVTSLTEFGQLYNDGQILLWDSWTATTLVDNLISHWSFDDGPFFNEFTAHDDLDRHHLYALPQGHGIETVKSSCPAVQPSGAVKDCEYEFAMEVDFPCPQFPAATVTATSRTVDPLSKWAAITFTSAGECGFDVDFDIDFPCVRLPEERVDAVVYSTPKGTEYAWIKFTQDEEGECIFDVDMEIAFPCPQFPVGPIYALTHRVSPGLEQAWISFLQDPYYGDCNRFSVEFEVDFPFPQEAGDGTGYKLAIMPCGKENVGLFCSEMPTPHFMDYVEVTLPPGHVKANVPIDEKFLQVCEPDSVICTAYTTDLPIPVGTTVKSGYLRVRRRVEDCSDAVTVVVTLSGVRHGQQGLRFPKFSTEQMERNNAFWSNAYV